MDKNSKNDRPSPFYEQLCLNTCRPDRAKESQDLLLMPILSVFFTVSYLFSLQGAWDSLSNIAHCLEI
jgi:hypothetical protein